MMNIFRTILLFPFRFFANGDALISNTKMDNRVRRSISQTNDKKINLNKGFILRILENKLSKYKKNKVGCKDAELFSSVFAFILTTTLFLWILAFVENTKIFQDRFGLFNITASFNKIGLEMPIGRRWIFYQGVISKAICSSEIALVQLSILYAVIFAGIRLCLKMVGASSTGSLNPTAHGTSCIMSLAIICLPAFGILSTVVGILSADFISREEAKILIFGPSGIGIIGFLIANLFYVLTEYINEK